MCAFTVGMQSSLLPNVRRFLISHGLLGKSNSGQWKNSADLGQNSGLVRCRATASKRKHLLILPGFLSGSASYKEMKGALNECGYSAEILEMDTSEWYPSLLGFSFEWYVERLSEAINHLFEQYGKVVLVGHSAAGWIARLCLGDESYMGLECGKKDKVEALITLGTPHLSLEDYPFGRFKEKVFCTNQELSPDVRSSSLRFANFLYGKASDLAPVRVICIVGDTFKGVELSFLNRLKYLLTKGKIPSQVAREAFAYASYKVNCGNGDAIGDGVCPLETSLLPEAEHVILPGVYHGPNSVGLPYYGSKEVVQEWIKLLSSEMIEEKQIISNHEEFRSR